MEGKEGNESENIEKVMRRMHSLDSALARDTINYVFTQLDDISLRGKINFYEYAVLMPKSQLGLFELCYLKHYSRDLTSKRVFIKAASTLINLLYTRVLNGLDYDLIKADIEAKKQVILQGR